MYLKRRIVKFGRGNGVFLPHDWLKYLEEKNGERPKLVTIETNDKLVIRPVFENKGEEDG